MISKKGAIEISFSWIFAITAGIIIIFLAIFISSRIMKTGEETVSAKTGREIQTLLNPLETDFEDSQAISIIIPVETRIKNGCEEEYGIFGRQSIQLDQKNYNKWTQTDIKVYSENKYIFSDKVIEGKEFYIFSKPFNFPFKVADLFYFSSSKEKYCFVNSPEDVLEEIKGIGNKTNLLTENCSEQDILVCFGGSPSCDINIIQENNGGYVVKNRSKVYFNGFGENTNSLMYAAIFSDKEIYECQVQRLMARTGELALLYTNKEERLEGIGCDGSLGEDLMNLRETSAEISNSSSLRGLTSLLDQIDSKNEIKRNCMLW